MLCCKPIGVDRGWEGGVDGVTVDMSCVYNTPHIVNMAHNTTGNRGTSHLRTHVENLRSDWGVGDILFDLHTIAAHTQEDTVFAYVLVDVLHEVLVGRIV
jgi:hypothetical protein